jgi:centromeric protein E
LQQELLATRRELETRSNQILSLEAALLARPELPVDAPESAKDQLIAEQSKTIRELEIVVRGYEENLGEPLRAVREDVEKEWVDKFAAEVKLREEKEEWAAELVRQLEKERKVCWVSCSPPLFLRCGLWMMLCFFWFFELVED